MEKIYRKLLSRKENIYVIVLVLACIFLSVLTYIRCFYGTEISDEAYYVAEAKEMLNGNIPYAVNDGSRAVGFTFLLIPIIFVFKLFSPNLVGVFLVTRLCFASYRFLIIYVFYKVIKKSIPIYYALLLSALLIPSTPFTISNFSYNSVPVYSMLLTAILVFDVVEQDHIHEKIKLIIAGVFSGIACFANPGYGIALFVLGALLFWNSEKSIRRNRLFFFGVGILAEIIVVVLPIMIQTSISKFLYGVYRIYINPIPVDSVAPDKSFTSVISSFEYATRNNVIIFLFFFILTYLFSRIYISKNNEKLDKTQCIVLSIAASFCITMFNWIFTDSGTDLSAVWGYTISIYFLIFLMTGIYKKNHFPYYIGLYPIFYSVIEIVLIDGGAGIGRFKWGFTVFIGVFYTLLIQKSKLVRVMSSFTIIMIVIAMVYSNFKYVYRDDIIGNLTHKVEEGVYAGIYTTETRSHDLPEMERYLNEAIGENDIYAFRDNVPFAYLMMHHGQMCELCTWDILQYTYKRNSPSILFDYYRCRDMIPEKIIYIDYGRDKNLSIEDPTFNYNRFIEAYYNQKSDFCLNDTFFHIITYEYNGNFDGDYNYWYETYYKRN